MMNGVTSNIMNTERIFDILAKEQFFCILSPKVHLTEQVDFAFFITDFPSLEKVFVSENFKKES